MTDQQAQDQLYRFGGGTATSTIALGTIVLVIIALLLLFLLPRRYAIVPYFCATLFIPFSQVIVLLGLHFNIYRLLLPFVWLRALMSSRSQNADEKFHFNGIDKAIIFWALTDTIAATLLWSEWAAFVNRIGFLYNAFGIYFLLRLLIRNRDDVNRMIKLLAFALAFTAIFMIVEQATGRNIFSIFGGVPEITAVREGRIRSQAGFAHSIIPGTLAATLLPLFVGAWWQGGKSRSIAVIGAVSALAMVICSSSSTPLAALMGGIVALCLWSFRRQMRLLRWALLAAVVGLHMVMKAPVWALIGRAGLVGGSASDHRYQLVNQAILHFRDWWLMGTKNPGSWGYDMWDISNAYVNVAVDGGLLALIFFLAIFWQCFKSLGIARQAAAEKDPKLERQVWSFGAALFATMVGYIGIWYFDQSIVVWWSLLAMIGAMASTAFAPATASEKADADVTPPWMRGRVPLDRHAGEPALQTRNRLGAVGLSSDKMRLPDWQRR